MGDAVHGAEVQQVASPSGRAGQVTGENGRDTLFQQVFGQRAKQNRPRQIDVPVRLDGREIGLVAARPSGDAGQTAIDIHALVKLLADRAQEDPLAALRSVAGEDGFARLSELPAGGVSVAYDPGDLSVAVSLPPALRRVVRLDVAGRTDAARGMLVLPPARISAYVNARAAVEYLSSPDPGRPDGRGPLGVVFEPALNLDGWVVEGETFYRESGRSRWERGPVRLVRDLPDSAIRLQAGDLIYPVTGSQVGQPLGGLSLARNFNLQPYRAIQPTGQRDFVLESSSVVEIFVNGRPTRSYRLEAGPYNLSNFPGATGTNDIQIRITDAFGRERTIEFPFFFDSQLLGDGIHEFAYTAGYPYGVGTGGISYDTDRLTFSGFHRIGVSDRLTLGASLQADRTRQVAGAEVLVATPLGTFGVEPLASFGPTDGYAVNLRYRDFRSGETIWRQRTVTGQVSWRDAAFAPFGTGQFRNLPALDAALRISQPLLQNLTATLGARWRETRSVERQDAYSVDLTLRRRLGRNGSMDITLSHDRDDFGDRETGAFFNLRYSFADGLYNTGFSVDTVARERRLDLRYQSLKPVDQWSLTFDAVNGAGNDRLQGGAGYVHQRFLANVRHDSVRRMIGNGNGTEHRTQLSAATAIAFADGHVGVSRPISNSFAMVVPHPRIADRRIAVDPVNGSHSATNDMLGPPILPSVTAYLVRPMHIEVLDLPPTYDIGEDRPAVLPGYRTGTIVPIGTDATVSLDGTLTAADGTAMALQSGVLEPVGAADGDEQGREAIQFFTNRRGRFRIESVRPGEWRLRLHGIEASVPIVVPREAEGVMGLGDVRLGG